MYGAHEDCWTREFRGEQHALGWDDTPVEGLMNVLPNAGDFVVMPEATCHGVLPWRGKEPRLSMVMRFKSGQSYVTHRRNRLRVGLDGPWPAEVVATLTPRTRAMISGGEPMWQLMVSHCDDNCRSQWCSDVTTGGYPDARL